MSTTITMILWMLMGVATAYFANQRGRDPYIWFALGIFFGVLAMLALVFLPSVKTDEETEADRRNQEIVGRREKQVEAEEKIENAPDLLPQSIQTKEWFYLDKARQQHGPISFYVMTELWQNGDLNCQSLVWTEGMSEWQKIIDTLDLHEAFDQLDTESKKAFPNDL